MNPDSLFALTNRRRREDESTLYCFLELERSRQGSHRDGRSASLRKLKRYAEYYGTERCLREREWFDKFHVVIVVANETRGMNLLLQLADVLPHPAFWVDRSSKKTAACSSGTDDKVYGYSRS